MAEARDRLVDTIVGLPLVGSYLGRTKVLKFVGDLEDTVQEAAAEGAEAQVKPMLVGTMAVAGIALILAIKNR